MGQEVLYKTIKKAAAPEGRVAKKGGHLQSLYIVSLKTGIKSNKKLYF